MSSYSRAVLVDESRPAILDMVSDGSVDFSVCDLIGCLDPKEGFLACRYEIR